MKRRIAFTPVIHENTYQVGAAEENIAGWSKTTYQTFKTWDEAKNFCDYLNTAKLHL